MPKGIVTSPNYYEDVRQLMDAAIERGTLIIKLESAGMASHVRQKCYRYRNFLRDQVGETSGLVPGHRPGTIYDQLLIRMIHREPGQRTSPWLEFTFARIEGQVLDDDGNLVDWKPEPEEGDVL